MKKKIKDLTLKERKKICKSEKGGSCLFCPLFDSCWNEIKNDESEVEVDE